MVRLTLIALLVSSCGSPKPEEPPAHEPAVVEADDIVHEAEMAPPTKEPGEPEQRLGSLRLIVRNHGKDNKNVVAQLGILEKVLANHGLDVDNAVPTKQ